jgi:hypothetical protein
LNTYDTGKQQYPNLPQHTENTNQNNNNTGTTKTAAGSPPLQPSEPPSTTVFTEASQSNGGNNGVSVAVLTTTIVSANGVGNASTTSTNPSSTTTPIVFARLDSTAPVAITNFGGTINLPTVTISGTVGVAYAGTTVTILDTYNGVTTPIGSTTVGPDGAWTASVTLKGDGVNSIVAQDASASSTSAAVVFALYTVPPTVAITSSGGSTNQTTQRISGNVTAAAGEAAVGSTVALFDTLNGATTKIGIAAVGPGGAWSTTVTLSGNGIHSIVAQDTDAAGNVGASTPVVFTVATTAPAAPTVSHLADAANNSFDAGFTVSTGAAVTVTVGGTALSAAQLASDFTKSTAGGLDTYTAKSGAFTGSESIAVSATLTDAAGNTSSPGTLTLNPVDTTAPPQPAAPSDSAVVNGIVDAANDTASQALSGTAEAGSTVKIYLNGAGTPAFTTTADALGNWSQTVGHLADGSYSYAVTATDAAGNTSAPSTALSFVVNTTAPGQPAAPTDGAVVNGYVNAANDTASQALSGTAAAGSTVNIYLNGAGTPAFTTTADALGNWSQTIGHLADGSYSYTVTVTAGGNTSVPSNPLSFIVDTTAPAVTIGNTGGSSNQFSQTVSGTVDKGDAGATVNIYDNSGTTPITTAVVQSDGTWSKVVTLGSG